MGFGDLYSRKGILYGVVASVLRKHPVLKRECLSLTHKTLHFLIGWSAWGRPHEIGRAGECLGFVLAKVQKLRCWRNRTTWHDSAAKVMEGSTCAVLILFRWHPTKSHRNMVGVGRENGRTLSKLRLTGTGKSSCSWQLHGNVTSRACGCSPRMDFHRLCFTCHLSSSHPIKASDQVRYNDHFFNFPEFAPTSAAWQECWVSWPALEWRHLLSNIYNIDWHWQCLKWSIWYDVFYILPLIHVDWLCNSDSPTALWAHHVWEQIWALIDVPPIQQRILEPILSMLKSNTAL